MAFYFYSIPIPVCHFSYLTVHCHSDWPFLLPAMCKWKNTLVPLNYKHKLSCIYTRTQSTAAGVPHSYFAHFKNKSSPFCYNALPFKNLWQELQRAEMILHLSLLLKQQCCAVTRHSSDKIQGQVTTWLLDNSKPQHTAIPWLLCFLEERLRVHNRQKPV